MNITGTVVMNARAISSGMIDLVSSNTYTVTPVGDKQTTLKPTNGRFNDYGIHLKNGVLGCANLLDSINGTEDATIAFWSYNTIAKTDLWLSWQTYNAQGQLMIFCQHQGLSGFCSCGQPWTYSTNGLTLNTWHHIAFTRSNGTSYFFEDGKLLWNGGFGVPLIIGNTFLTDALNHQYSDSNRYTQDTTYDDLIAIKGQALWTADYTVPTDYITGSDISVHNTPLYYDNTVATVRSYYLKQY